MIKPFVFLSLLSSISFGFSLGLWHSGDSMLDVAILSKKNNIAIADIDIIHARKEFTLSLISLKESSHIRRWYYKQNFSLDIQSKIILFFTKKDRKLYKLEINLDRDDELFSYFKQKYNRKYKKIYHSESQEIFRVNDSTQIEVAITQSTLRISYLDVKLNKLNNKYIKSQKMGE